MPGSKDRLDPSSFFGPGIEDADRAGGHSLPSLLALFSASDVSRHAGPIERARQIWSETLARDGVVALASDEDAKIVSTCMLITAPNLLRGGRPHGMIENG